MKVEDIIKITNYQHNKSMEEYIIAISDKCEIFIPKVKKPINIKDDNVTIPNIKNYYQITQYNYSIKQLKSFTKIYKIKSTGNKSVLISRLFAFLHLSSFIIKIQKIFRGFLQRKYNSIQGPGFKNIHLCNNNTDFVTMEELKELKQTQFFSFRDEDGFVYGFDIASLYNLIFKNGIVIHGVKTIGGINPYNRNSISGSVIKNIKSFIRLSKLFNIKIVLDIENDISNISDEKAVELRALSLFQIINSLGNYSDAQWFLSLNRNQLIKFVRELIDIWEYRAQLPMDVKINICPPNGDPFRNMRIQYIHTEPNLNNVKNLILEYLEKLVNSGVDQDSKSLGAYYILGALTLVSVSASTTLPWLFQSVNYYSIM